MSAVQKVAERAYTVEEVAELKGVSKEYVARAIRATEGNTLAAKNISTSKKVPRYRISASAVETWWAGLPDS